ncbi:hypothetical protein ATY75_07965 [Rhizobium sp. N122]|nr:hypothetical protein ATY75_07965 [Rhizobium sp. N122]
MESEAWDTGLIFQVRLLHLSKRGCERQGALKIRFDFRKDWAQIPFMEHPLRVRSSARRCRIIVWDRSI